jgi:hypothetical protein
MSDADSQLVREISERVYRERLGPGDLARMLEKDNDGGKKMRVRAASYDSLTRAYIKALRDYAADRKKTGEQGR